MDKQKRAPSPVVRKKSAPHDTLPERKTLQKDSIFDKPWFYPVIVLTLTFVVFLPVFSSEFMTTWDDNVNITDNLIIRSLSFENIRQMFTTQVGSAYIPLPLLTFAIEYKLFGLSSGVFHFTNLMLQLACTFFVFMILRQLGLKPLYAAFGALLFGVHPMGVESVAWASERKDMMYTLFYLASVMSYLRYVEKGKFPVKYLVISLGLYLLALFSKIQAVSLPLVLLAVDYYLGRPLKPRLVVEKIPFFALSLIFGIAGIFILRDIGAFKVNEIYSFQDRLFYGAYAFNAYLLKFIVPLGLSALYPYPVNPGQALPILYYLSPLMIAVVAAAVFFSRKWGRTIPFGMLFFSFSVVFLLQIFGAGQGFLADRFTKVPYVGLVFMVVCLLQQYLEKNGKQKVMVLSGLAGILLIFMVVSYQRTKIWKNGEVLWSDVIQKYPDKSSRPYACRGIYYKETEQNEKALKDFTRDIELDPADVEILQFRGNIYFNKGRDDSAYADYIRALRLKQDNALTFANLGAIYVRRNQMDSALYLLTKGLEMDSTQTTSYANRAVVYGAIGKPDESIADFKRYLRAKPDDERVIFSIGMIYFNKGDMKESINWFSKAITIKPDLANYHWLRSQAYRHLGQKTEAIADAEKAGKLGMTLPPDYLPTLR